MLYFNWYVGSWFYIMRFLNVASIISNAFLIAFTSNWSKTFLENKLEYKFVFVVAFEVVRINFELAIN